MGKNAKGHNLQLYIAVFFFNFFSVYKYIFKKLKDEKDN